MTDKSMCPECGVPLAKGAAQGLCPRCLLKAGLNSLTLQAEVTDGAGPSGASRPAPQVGDRLGRFRILRALGRGGMGMVFEAEEEETGRRVALKVIGRRLASPEDRARFLREGRLAAAINHPNSVYVYSAEEIEGTPAIAMELVSGGTLQERVSAGGPMAVCAAVDAILQIIAGLEAAEKTGILHRDVKPGNCFVDAGGAVKIGDFGLSISSAGDAEASVTATGTMMGTPAYCSPEQLRGQELSAKSDQYSVGGTLFYLLTGRTPFEGHTGPQLIANVLEQSAPSPRQFRKEVPAGLARVVQRCLAKLPSDRFRCYDDLRQALAPYSSTVPAPAPLGRRFLAGVLDSLFLGMITTPPLFALVRDPLSPDFLWRNRWAYLAVNLFYLLYYAVAEGIWGATPGKALCRLRVVREGHQPPGILRELIRFILYPLFPMLVCDVGSYLHLLVGQLGLAAYILPFVTMRRRNGLAAIHDLLTRTRVITRTPLLARPVAAALEPPPPALESKVKVGPYHVLESLGKHESIEWLLGYDLRLLRKVWLCLVPPGTTPVPASWRSADRPGRLRWLSGRRSAEENWDAFEAVAGQPLLRRLATPAAWSQVRFWLHDLAGELDKAGKDGTLPSVLALDRVWIGADGRAKLLDFPAPGLAAGPGAAAPGSRAFGSAQEFLGAVAVVALTGKPDADVAGQGAPAMPLPLDAREFLTNLPDLPDMEAVTGALQPLLSHVTEISRLRRAAVVAACAAFPLLSAVLLLGGTVVVINNPASDINLDLGMIEMMTSVIAGAMINVVMVPALFAALLFRGGLVLRLANMAFVRRDGAPASRLRVFWRVLVAWLPILAWPPGWYLVTVSLFRLAGVIIGGPRYVTMAADLLIAGVIAGLAVVSLLLPRRGLADRLAGTWPVPGGHGGAAAAARRRAGAARGAGPRINRRQTVSFALVLLVTLAFAALLIGGPIDAAVRYIRLVSVGDPAVSAQAAMRLPEGGARDEALLLIALRWGGEDPKAASQWAMGLPEGKTRDEALANVACAWANKDPQAAAKWAQQLPEESARNKAVHSLVYQWARKDPRAAVTWALRLPEGDGRDSALAVAVRSWASKAPQAAVRWAVQLPEGAPRNVILDELARGQRAATNAPARRIAPPTN